MKRAILLTCLLCLLAMPAAAAGAGPARVRLGRVTVTPPVDGRSSLLVSAGYPIEMAGHRLSLSASIFRGASGFQSARLRPLANAGPPRLPDRRRRFTFVHRIPLSRGTTEALSHSALLMAKATSSLDVNGDGKPELLSGDSALQEIGPAPRGGPLCSTVPLQRVEPGQRVVVAVPVCTPRRHWRIETRPEHGSARIVGTELVYRPAAKFQGTDSLRLSGGAPVVFKVGTEQTAVVRAIGDSVTAGFGYYDNGSQMGLLELP